MIRLHNCTVFSTSTVLKSHQAGKVTSSPWHGGDTEKSHQVVESHSSRWAAGEQQQASSRQAAGKQQQKAATKSSNKSSKQQHGAASSRQAAGEQQQVSSSKQQQVAGKQQGSSRQAAGKQQASSRQAATSVCPLERMIKYIFFNQCNKKIELFPAARPQNNEIVQLLKVVVMPNLNFFQAHGLPIRLLQADTT